MEPIKQPEELPIEPTMTPILPTEPVTVVPHTSQLPFVLGVLLFLSVGVAVFFYFRSMALEQNLSQLPSPTPAASPSLAPTPTPELSPIPLTSPTPSPKPIKVRILDTTNWVEESCGEATKITFKIQTWQKAQCTNNPDGTADVVITHEGGIMWDAQIQVRSYDGGSRRQHWISSMQASDQDVAKYVRFQESQFGTVIGLDVFASSGWWQGGYSSPILIANGKTIVSIYGGRDFDDTKNKIIRYDITDSIASTIKFVNE